MLLCKALEITAVYFGAMKKYLLADLIRHVPILQIINLLALFHDICIDIMCIYEELFKQVCGVETNLSTKYIPTGVRNTKYHTNTSSEYLTSTRLG